MVGSDPSQAGSENQPPSSVGNRGRHVGFSSPMKFVSSGLGSSPKSASQQSTRPGVAGRRGLRDIYSTSPMRFDGLGSQATARRGGYLEMKTSDNTPARLD